MVFNIMESDFGGSRRDDKQRETIEQILSKVKDATFGFMFNVSRQTSGDTPIFFHYLELIIELFQNMAFPILFTWAPWTPDIQWFRDFISYLTPWQYFLQSQEAYYSMLGILGILFITSATIAYASTQHKIRFAGPIKLLRLLLLAISGPLYLPMFGLMIFTALDCNDPHYDSIDCHSGLFIVRAIGTFLMGLLYMMLSLQVRVACFEFEPKAKDLTCRPHSRLDIVYILFRTILVVTALVLILYGGGPRGDESMPNWIMCIMCLVFSGILAYGHIWYIPYYNYRYSQLRAGIFLNFFWASLCYLYTNILHDSDIGIILVIGIPVVFVLAAFLVHSRRRMIEEMPKNGITDPLILELKARFILIRENLLYPSSQAEALSRNGKSPGDIGYVAPKANSGPDESRAAKEASVYAEINSMYVQGVKDMSKSCMLQIMIGTFQIVYLKNRAQCLAVTTKAAGLRPHPDEAFMIFKRHRDLNERAIGSDGVDFIAFERHLATAKKNERKATISIVQFWAELMKRHPSIHKLETYGSAITSAITAARGSYLTLIKLSPNSPNVYRMYGAFLINVINDAKKGQELIDHAEEIEEEAQRETGFRNELDDDGVPGVAEEMSMFSEDNGLITISGEKSNMCQVIHANPAFLKLFGFKKHELVGENINKIIPNPFCTIHDVLVSRYVETGFAKVIDRVRQVLGLNGDGYLFVFILCVKHIVDPEGKQSFVGVVKPGPSRPNAGNVIMNDGFTILHASENVCRLLGIRPRQTMDFNIRDIFPKINHDVLTSKAGMKGVLTSGGEKFEIEWFGDALPLNGSNCYICRVKFNASGEGIGSRSSISAEDKPMVFSPHGSEHDLRQTKSISIQSSQMSQQIYGRKASTSSAGGCPFMPADRRVSMAPALPPIPTNASLTRRLSSAKAADIRENNLRDVPRGPNTPTNPSALPKKNVVRRSSSGSRTNLKNKYETQLRITVARKNAQVTGNLMALHTLFQALFAILIFLALYSNHEFNAIFNGTAARLTQIQNHAQLTSDMVVMIDGVRSIDIYRYGQQTRYLQIATNVSDSRAIVKAKFQTLKKNRINILNLYGTLITIGSPVRNKNRTIDAMEVIFGLNTLSDYAAVASPQDLIYDSRMKYILTNGPTWGIELMNLSSTRELKEYNAFIHSQGNWVVVFSSIGPILSLLLLLCLFPVHYTIEVKRKEFLKMFFDIPKNVVKGIYQSRLQRMLEGVADRSGSDEGSDDDLTNQLNIDGMNASHDSVQQDATTIVHHNGEIKEPFSFAKAYHRYMFDQRGIGLKCWLILAVSCVYFIVSGYNVQTFINANTLTGNSLYWNGQRLAMMKRASFWLREGYIDVVLATNKTGINIFDPDTDKWKTLTSDLNWVDYGVLYGNPTMEGVPLTKLEFTDPQVILELNDACVDTSPSDCETYWSGLVTRGLRAVIMKYVIQADLILSMIDQMKSKNAAAPTVAQMEYLYDMILQLRQLDTKYVTPALIQALNYIVQNPQSSALWFNTFHLAFTVCVVACLFLYYLIVIRALLRYMQEEIRRTSGLVYMLPADVLLTMPSFKKWSGVADESMFRSQSNKSLNSKLGETSAPPSGHLSSAPDKS